MYKKIFITAIFLIFFSSAYSQDNKIEFINSQCEEINKNIEENYGFYLMHQLIFQSNVRAIGIQNTSIKFFYTQPQDSLIENNGNTEFLYIYKPPPKIKVEYNIAASQNITVEYYLDNEGNLIYYSYLTTGLYTNGKEQYYFNNNIPIMIKIEAIEGETEVLEKYRFYEKETDFNESDLEIAKKIIGKKNAYIDLFNKMPAIEKIDK